VTREGSALPRDKTVDENRGENENLVTGGSPGLMYLSCLHPRWQSGPLIRLCSEGAEDGTIGRGITDGAAHERITPEHACRVAFIALFLSFGSSGAKSQRLPISHGNTPHGRYWFSDLTSGSLDTLPGLSLGHARNAVAEWD
jgi:hypothetical protein